ncbi:hypothetical protein MIR68_010887 [Amoeboaphelidium protococcarum]|nr:hypothetical protein MIR68_010887 [Amoeboaphelidium protococcarum]
MSSTNKSSADATGDNNKNVKKDTWGKIAANGAVAAASRQQQSGWSTVGGKGKSGSGVSGQNAQGGMNSGNGGKRGSVGDTRQDQKGKVPSASNAGRKSFGQQQQQQQQQGTYSSRVSSASSSYSSTVARNGNKSAPVPAKASSPVVNQNQDSTHNGWKADKSASSDPVKTSPDAPSDVVKQSEKVVSKVDDMPPLSAPAKKPVLSYASIAQKDLPQQQQQSQDSLSSSKSSIGSEQKNTTATPSQNRPVVQSKPGQTSATKPAIKFGDFDAQPDVVGIDDVPNADSKLNVESVQKSSEESVDNSAKQDTKDLKQGSSEGIKQSDSVQSSSDLGQQNDQQQSVQNSDSSKEQKASSGENVRDPEANITHRSKDTRKPYGGQSQYYSQKSSQFQPNYNAPPFGAQMPFYPGYPPAMYMVDPSYGYFPAPYAPQFGDAMVPPPLQQQLSQQSAASSNVSTVSSVSGSQNPSQLNLSVAQSALTQGKPPVFGQQSTSSVGGVGATSASSSVAGAPVSQTPSKVGSFGNLSSTDFVRASTKKKVFRLVDPNTGQEIKLPAKQVKKDQPPAGDEAQQEKSNDEVKESKVEIKQADAGAAEVGQKVVDDASQSLSSTDSQKAAQQDSHDQKADVKEPAAVNESPAPTISEKVVENPVDKQIAPASEAVKSQSQTQESKQEKEADTADSKAVVEEPPVNKTIEVKQQQAQPQSSKPTVEQKNASGSHDIKPAVSENAKDSHLQGKEQEDEVEVLDAGKVEQKQNVNVVSSPLEEGEEPESLEEHGHTVTQDGKRIYTIDFLLSLRDQFKERPADLPSMEAILGEDAPGQRRQSKQRGSADHGRPLAGRQTDIMPSSMKGSRYSGVQRQTSGKAPPPGLPPGLNVKAGGNAPTQQQRRSSHAFGSFKQSKSDRRSAKNQQPDISILNQTEDRWMPSALAAPGQMEANEKMKRQVRSFLNKLTVEKFTQISDKMVLLPLENADMLKDMIQLIFDKATDEWKFSEMYAQLCLKLWRNLKEFPQSYYDALKQDDPDFDLNNITINILFRKLLLAQCQSSFEERTKWANAEALNVTDEMSKEDLAKVAEIENERRKQKRRYLGNVKFFGQLFKAGILSHAIIYRIFKSSLSDENMKNMEEEEAESLCDLMITVGEKIDQQDAKGYIDEIFSRLSALSKDQKISMRVRFKIQDVIELRQRKWQQRSDANLIATGPMKLDQARRLAEEQAQKQKGLPPVAPRRSDPPKRVMSNGWNVVSNQKSATSSSASSFGSQGATGGSYSHDNLNTARSGRPKQRGFSSSGSRDLPMSESQSSLPKSVSSSQEMEESTSSSANIFDALNDDASQDEEDVGDQVDSSQEVEVAATPESVNDQQVDNQEVGQETTAETLTGKDEASQQSQLQNDKEEQVVVEEKEQNKEQQVQQQQQQQDAGRDRNAEQK